MYQASCKGFHNHVQDKKQWKICEKEQIQIFQKSMLFFNKKSSLGCINNIAAIS